MHRYTIRIIPLFFRFVNVSLEILGSIPNIFVTFLKNFEIFCKKIYFRDCKIRKKMLQYMRCFLDMPTFGKKEPKVIDWR